MYTISQIEQEVVSEVSLEIIRDLDDKYLATSKISLNPAIIVIWGGERNTRIAISASLLHKFGGYVISRRAIRRELIKAGCSEAYALRIERDVIRHVIKKRALVLLNLDEIGVLDRVEICTTSLLYCWSIPWFVPAKKLESLSGEAFLAHVDELAKRIGRERNPPWIQ